PGLIPAKLLPTGGEIIPPTRESVIASPKAVPV
ncbi:unnamed protein product, partial [marine sediment metagenome]